MQLKRSTILGKFKFIFCLILTSKFLYSDVYSENLMTNERFAELNILDKVSSKTSKLKIDIGKELIIQNLIINVLK